ncbi:MAG: type II toxin-antitoxin system Phd/YefM family antitoxin [Pyrinomonadaceae bacterium]
MAHRTTYTAARANFASLCDKAADDREVIIISRRNSGDVALVAAKELSSLLETAHLLRSPKNARRLLSALNRATARKGKAQPLDKLRREMGLDSKT